MKLINHCRDILQAAEKRIEKITASSKDAKVDSDEPEDEEKDASKDNAEEGLF